MIILPCQSAKSSTIGTAMGKTARQDSKQWSGQEVGVMSLTCIEGLPDQAAPKRGSHADPQALKDELPEEWVRLGGAVRQLEKGFGPLSVEQRNLSGCTPAHSLLQTPAQLHTKIKCNITPDNSGI